MAQQDLVLEVRIDAIEEPRTGVSRNGNNYYSQTFQGTILGYSPKVIRFDVWGEDRVKMMNLQVGKTYSIKIDLESRPYVTQDGRTIWSNDIKCYSAFAL